VQHPATQVLRLHCKAVWEKFFFEKTPLAPAISIVVKGLSKTPSPPSTDASEEGELKFMKVELTEIVFKYWMNIR